MRFMHFKGAILLCAALLLNAFLIEHAQATEETSSRQWTIMIFMNGKNNLEPDALNNFYAMASIGSTEKVAIVTELGRPKKPTSAEGGWSGVYRFLVKKDLRPRPENAVEKVPAGIKSDMGRVETLTEFMAWAKAKYPAQHYMLIVWNHGQGYRLQMSALVARATATKVVVEANVPAQANVSAIGGFRAVSSDDDTGSILFNSEVQKAIASNFSGSEKLDVIGFDACLMAMLETAYALDPSARFMIGSEELEPGDGWQYAKWLDKVVANPNMSSEDVGRAVVASYGDHYGDTYFTTLSLLDLSQVKPAAGAISSLADAVRQGGPKALDVMKKARSDLSSYADWDTPPSYLSVDLLTLLERFQARVSDAGLKKLTGQTIKMIEPIVVTNYASTRSKGELGDVLYGSRGIAIYYPRSFHDFDRDYFHEGYLKENQDRPIAFVRNERWAELLYALLGL